MLMMISIRWTFILGVEKWKMDTVVSRDTKKARMLKQDTQTEQICKLLCDFQPKTYNGAPVSETI